MSQTQSNPITSSSSALTDERAVKIMAKSVFRELKANGATRGDIVRFTSELLSLVTSEVRAEEDGHSRAS